MKHRSLFFIILCLITTVVFTQTKEELNKSLLDAVRSGDFEKVKIALEKGANVNEADENKATPLMWSAYKGDLPILKYLLEKGADPQKKGIIWIDQEKTSFHGSILNCAAGVGQFEMIKFLIEECGLNADDVEVDAQGIENGWTPLITAVSKGYEDIVKYLLSKKINLNFIDSTNGGAAIHFAVSLGEKEIVEILVSKGADINIQTTAGRNPLFLAILNGKKDIELYLLEKGANIDNKERKIAESQFLIDTGDELTEKSRDQEAIDSYKKSLEITLDIGDKIKEAEILNKMGMVYGKMFQYDNALQFFDKALIIYRNAGDKKNQAETIAYLGVLAMVKQQNNQAINFFKQALSLYRDTGDKLGMANVYSCLGYTYHSDLKLNESIKNLKKAQEIFNKLGKQMEEAEALIILADGHRLQSNFKLSIEYSEKALRIYEHFQNKVEKVIPLANIGASYLSTGEYEKACDYFNQALSIAKENSNHYMVGILLNNIGYVYLLRCQYDDAVKEFQKALQILEETGNNDLAGIILNNLGEMHLLLGQNEKALKYLESALESSRKFGLKYIEVAASANLGGLYLLLNRKKESMEYLNRALTMFKEMGDQRGTGYVKTTIGSFFSISGADKLANNYFKEADSLIRNVKDPIGKAAILRGMGYFQYCSSNYDKAIDFFEQARAIMHNFGNHLFEGLLLNHIGIIYCKLKQYDKACQSFEQSLNISQKIGNSLLACDSLINLGQNYEYQQKYREAGEYYEKSLKISREIKNQRMELISLKNLGGVHAALKQYEKANDYYKHALEIAEQINEITEEDTLLNQLSEVCLNLKQFDRSVGYLEKSLKINQKSGNKTRECAVLIRIGELYYLYIKNLDKAKEYLEEGLSKSHEIDDRSIRAAILSNIAPLYRDIQQVEKAINNYNELLKLEHESGNVQREILVLEALGNIYKQKWPFNKAIDYYNRALKIVKKNNIHSREVALLRDIGEVYYLSGEYAKSLTYYNQALAIANTREKALTLMALGTVYTTIKQPHNAKKSLQSALDLVRGINDRKEQANVLSRFGDMYVKLSDFQKATIYIEQALAIFPENAYKSVEMALVLFNLGWIYRDYYENYDKAMEYLKESLEIIRSIKAFKYESDILEHIGWVYWYRKDYVSGEEAMKQALDKILETKNPQKICELKCSLGAFYFSIDNNKAIQLLSEAKKMASELELLSTESQVRINIAQVYIKNGNRKEAIEELEKGILLLEKIRIEGKPKKSIQFSKEYYMKVFKYLFEIYYESGDYQKAFKTAERSKSVIFSEMINERFASEKFGERNPGFRNLMEKTKSLSMEKKRIETRMINAKNEELVKLSSENKKKEEEINLVQEQMKRGFPKYAAMLYPKHIDVKGIQKILRKDETYISYYFLEKYAIAFVVTKAGFDTIKLKMDIVSSLKEKIPGVKKELSNVFESIALLSGSKLTRELSNIFQYPKDSYELYQLLFKPMEAHIKTRKILLSADGDLLGLPLEALVIEIPDAFELNKKKYSLDKLQEDEIAGNVPFFYEYLDMKYLGNRYSISYIPSASVLDVIIGRLELKKTATNGVLAFADPVFKTGKDERAGKVLVRLPDTAIESQEFINRIGQGQLLTGFDATEENLWKTNVEKARYILISTHGLPGNEMDKNGNTTEPSLVLTQVNNPDGYDGYLDMSEAAGLELNSDLAILAACFSGGDSGNIGDSFLGMARSFLLAGTQAVVASHWQVDTRATRLLMSRFAQNLRKDDQLGALEDARNTIKKEIVEYGKDEKKIKVSYAHPYFWSSFVYWGAR